MSAIKEEPSQWQAPSLCTKIKSDKECILSKILAPELINKDSDFDKAEEFRSKHPSYKRPVKTLSGITEMREVTVYHEVFNVMRQSDLADPRISLGYLHHLSDNEDDCPCLITFYESYGELACRWLVEHISAANVRVSAMNLMNADQMAMAARAIIYESPYLNLAEIVRFFGLINAYLDGNGYMFGETQIMQALKKFKAARLESINIYDRDLYNKKIALQKEEWRKTGVTFTEWSETDEGKVVINDLEEWGREHQVNILGKLKGISTPYLCKKQIDLTFYKSLETSSEVLK